MTEHGAEPSNADLFALIQQGFAHLTTEISGVKADVDDVKAGVLTLAEELGHEIAQSEARLTSRIGDVQQVVQRMKADLAAHIADPEPHDRRRAA